MSDAVSTIRNLGPAMEQAFGRVGITSAQEIHDLGPDTAYAKLILEGRERPHFIAYYALVLGLQGRPWNDLQPQEKAALRERFDAIKEQGSGTKPQSDLEQALDALGLPDPKT